MGNRRLQTGFGLIEVMIGIVISIIASVVMFQTFSVSERQKRTTTGAADAQSNGAVALFMMERDIKMAGWGLQLDDFISGCKTIYSYYDDGTSPGPIDGLFATVKITDGGTTTPDSIRIQYYDDPKGQANNYRLGTTELADKVAPAASVELNVKNPHVCNIDTDGDGKYPFDHDNDDKPLAIIRDKVTGNCTLMEITSVQGTALKLQANSGEGNYNPAWSYQKDNNWPSYESNSEIQCFRGLAEYRRTYQVVNQQLELVEPNSAGVAQTYQMAPGIVDMQAQYGITDAGGQKVTAWVDAAGATWASPSVANSKRIIAVRLALLARSATYEKPDDGSTNCTTTTTTMATNWSPWATFNTGTYPSDWQCYRYKVFEIEVPLRNIIWAKPWG